MFEYHISAHFESKEELSLSELHKRLSGIVPEGANLSIHAFIPSSEDLPGFVAADRHEPDHPADPVLPVAAEESESRASAVPDAPVVDNGTAATAPGTPDPVIDKETLKRTLFKLRDEKGADAVKALYAKCGNGAMTLKTLDESCYSEMYKQAVSILAQ